MTDLHALSHPKGSAHPERIVPDETVRGIVSLHLARYAFALSHVGGKRVLDLACGVGYGSHYLAEHGGAAVVGIDICPEAIRYARRRYQTRQLSFLVADAARLPLRDAAVDVVTAFECIEHFDDPPVVVAELARVLDLEGTLVVSTPHVVRTDHDPDNPYHRIEYSRADFETLLRSRFDEITMLGQRRLQSRAHGLLQRLDVLGLRRWLIPSRVRRASNALLGTTSIEDLDLTDIVIEGDGIEHASELVAVCRRPLRSGR